MNWEEFSKGEIIQYIEHCNDFFDEQNITRNEGGGILSVYGRLIRYAEFKNNELAAIRAQLTEAEEIISMSARMVNRDEVEAVGSAALEYVRKYEVEG